MLFHASMTHGAPPSTHRATLRTWGMAHAGDWVEIAVIVLWAMWVGQNYLNLDPTLWPAGTGLGGKAVGHYFWIAVKQCGLCALWNGAVNGGAPALADRFGSQFHPLVAITTLLWGIIPGLKITLIAIHALTGIAQWWIARALSLGRLARLWSALLAVIGGHLATKYDEGNFGVLLAIATCSLTLAAALALGVKAQRRPRDVVIVAGLGAMAIVAGQGYIQLALLSWAPAFLFLLFDQQWHLKSVWRAYALAVGLSLLLAAVVLVPSLHFANNFDKAEADPNFSFAQPLEYIPLNLVIRDWAFYMNDQVLGKLGHNDLLYIGWVPIILLPIGLRLARRAEAPALLTLLSGVGLTFFVASAIPLRWLAPWFPVLRGFRFTAVMSNLAVPGVLSLAAFGLDRLWQLPWPRVSLPQPLARWPLDLRWGLIVPLAWSFNDVYDFSSGFLITRDMASAYQAVEVLQTPSLQWVAVPYDEADWVEPALARGIKIADYAYYRATWRGRTVPAAHLIAQRDTTPPEAVLVGELAGVPLYTVQQNQYAAVFFSDGQMTPCAAHGLGGDLTVHCQTDRAGELVVQENLWTGWQATRDALATPLLQPHGERWLRVSAPAGEHTYTFLYRPWDVYLGLTLSLVGLGLAMNYWKE